MSELAIIFLVILTTALDLAAVAARTAFGASSYARVLALRDEVGKPLDRTLNLFQARARLDASLSIALVVMRFALAGLLLYSSLSWAGSSAARWAIPLILLAAALLLAFLELGAQARAGRTPERTAARLSSFTRLLVVLFWPFASITILLGKKQFGPEEAPITVTEDELKTMVDAGQEEGVIEQGERRMIYSIIELGDTLVREIMVPRIDILALEVDTPLFEAVDALMSSGHSRVPIYQDSIDNTIGLLYAKDLLRAWREGQQLASLRSLLRPTHYVPEAKKVYELLAEMQSKRIHMAVVVDEYGGIAGLVTLEDIIEEILGEIQDEYDQAEELPFQRLKNGDYIFQGRVDLDDFNEIMGSNLEKDEAETLGGFVYRRLGHVPQAGELAREGRLLLVVEQVSAQRIRKIRARWSALDEGQSEEEINHADG